MSDSTYLSHLGKLADSSRVMPWKQTLCAFLSQAEGSDSLATRVCYNWEMSRSVRDGGLGSG